MGYSFFVTIKGKTQGEFKSESPLKKGGILGLSFAYELKSPRDPATGQATGKRQHFPIRITKAWGAASPQLFTALTTNEVLTEVKLEFRRTNAGGEEYVYQSIRLTDASVSQIRQFTNEAATAGDSSAKRTSANDQELEEISFTFHKIEIENKDGKTMGQDDWGSNN